MPCPLCQLASRQAPLPGAGTERSAPSAAATKRLVEIRCPSDCGYLASSRQHPAAVTRRQHEQDVLLLTPAIAELTDRQSRFFFLFQSIVARQPSRSAEAARRQRRRGGRVEPRRDRSRRASRGVIYEQRPQSLPAQDLAAAFRKAFEEVTAQLQGPRTPLERDAAKAFDAAGRSRAPGGAARRRFPAGLLELVRRILGPEALGGERAPRAHGPLIILPLAQVLRPALP